MEIQLIVRVGGKYIYFFCTSYDPSLITFLIPILYAFIVCTIYIGGIMQLDFTSVAHCIMKEIHWYTMLVETKPMEIDLLVL